MTTQIQTAQSFVDGSGLEALITIEGWAFACNYLGQPSCKLVINKYDNTPRNHKKLHAIALQAYNQIVKAQGPRFFEMNHAMYRSDAAK